MALKNCPACKKQVGPRTKTCDCGHTFVSTAVPASGQSMTLDPLEKRIGESVGAVKDIIAKVENRPATSVIPADIPTDTRRTQIVAPQPLRHYGGGIITTPAGAPPATPKGYKAGWPDGPASDDVVRDWAYAIMDAGRYAPEAVVYWARNFWDINGPEFKRVRGLIVQALRPAQPSHVSEDEAELAQQRREAHDLG